MAFVAPGLGHIWRGYEAATIEAADALRHVVDVRTYGARSVRLRGLPVRGLPTAERGWLETRLRASPLWSYRIEQLTFSVALAGALAVEPVDIVHVCDRGVARTLTRLQKTGKLVRSQIVFCNGGNYGPDDVGQFDFGQLMTPFQWDTMVRAGISPARLSIIPHGLHCARFRDLPVSQAAARRTFGLPDDARLILSVTPWDFTKRLDHLIREIERLADPNVFLVVAGQPTGTEGEIRRLAEAHLPNRHLFLSPDRARMPTLYRATDVVALCRLDEGFPMAYLETMAAERPLLVHDWQLSRWLVPSEHSRVDMTAEGALAERLGEVLARPDLAQSVARVNAAQVETQFDWSVLRPRYLEMYEQVLRLRPVQGLDGNRGRQGRAPGSRSRTGAA